MSSILDKLTGFFDRGFLVAYVVPSVVGVAFLLLLVAVEAGRARVGLEWATMSTTWQGWAIAIAVVYVGASALLLQLFTGTLIRFYEGYAWPARLARVGRARQKILLRDRLEERPDESRLLPTAFGNMLRAAEEHPLNLFGMDCVRWWPRLMQVVPPELHGQLWGSLVPVIALLNISTVLSAVVITAAIALLMWGQTWWLFPVAVLGGCGAARLCYCAAVTQAAGYGALIRAAFELYRHRILNEMGIELPSSFEDEQYLWKALTDWIASPSSPPSALAETNHNAPAWMRAPFYYRRKAPEEKGLRLRPIDVTLRIQRPS